MTSGRANTEAAPVRAADEARSGGGCYFSLAQDGKVTEFHAHPDAVGLMAQLGIMPGTGLT